MKPPSIREHKLRGRSAIANQEREKTDFAVKTYLPRLNEFWLSPIFSIDGMFSFMLKNLRRASIKRPL